MKKYIWPTITGILAIIIIALLFVQFKSSENLANQSRCASQAKTFFDDTNDSSAIGEYYIYQDHYNSGLDKCYVVVTGYSKEGESKQLWDAFENRSIADCEVYTDPNLDFCSYNGSSTEYDLDAFDTFTKPFMDD